MTAIAWPTQLQRIVDRLQRNAIVLAVFSATLFLSALLLFSVQPVFAKMVLPQLGGTPSVWAISMCFFQAVLLLGYCYAYLVNRLVAPRRAPLVHLALLAIAALALPFGLPAGVAPPPGDAYLWLIGVLTLGVGLPFLAVSANAPLLQAWFARTGHPHANDPYFLYGASNLGSLVALLAYPVAIEPVWGLLAQSRIWSAGFCLLAAAIAVCGLQMLLCLDKLQSRPVQQTAAPEREAAAALVTWPARLHWIGLAFVPSGLLVAFSSYVTTDIASAPFIWVIPLAMFLATFIMVFRDRPLIPQATLLVLQPALVGVTLMGLSIFGALGWLLASLAGIAAFFVTTLVAHRELYERRPAPRHLTEFYLWMSFGGVLGGVFSAIVAPQIFNALLEFPLLLLLGLACRPRLGAVLALTAERRDAARQALAGFGVLICLALVLHSGLVGKGVAQITAQMTIVTLALAMQLLRERALRLLVAGTLATACLLLLPTAMNLGQSERSFFGVHRIVVEQLVGPDGRDAGEARMLMHGTTMHGFERTRDERGQPIVGAPPVSSYYHRLSPLYHALQAARQAFVPREGRPFSVGVVGLGTGTMTCNALAGERWRLFEIDPVVVRIAQSRFSFLKQCMPGADVVVGDARLTLGREQAARFDYLMIDAFSSDAIPIHLLTREALLLYLDKLAPDGVLALHITNRHLELSGVTDALVASIPGLHAVNVIDDRGPFREIASSTVVAMSRSAPALAPLAALAGASPARPTQVRPWTDDYSNILPALFRNYWR